MANNTKTLPSEVEVQEINAFMEKWRKDPESMPIRNAYGDILIPADDEVFVVAYNYHREACSENGWYRVSNHGNLISFIKGSGFGLHNPRWCTASSKSNNGYAQYGRNWKTHILVITSFMNHELYKPISDRNMPSHFIGFKISTHDDLRRACAMLSNRIGGLQVDHIDGNTANNTLTNLRLVTKGINELAKTNAYYDRFEDMGENERHYKKQVAAKKMVRNTIWATKKLPKAENDFVSKQLSETTRIGVESPDGDFVDIKDNRVSLGTHCTGKLYISDDDDIAIRMVENGYRDDIIANGGADYNVVYKMPNGKYRKGLYVRFSTTDGSIKHSIITDRSTIESGKFNPVEVVL